MTRSIEKREQALQRVRQIEALSEVQRLEPRALTAIIDEALDTLPDENHWIAYERLKRTAKSVVGWGAARNELGTRSHYEAMLGFIEWLLPEPQEERELLEFDEPLYDDDEEEPAFVPRRASRIASGFAPLGQIIEGTLGDPPKQIEGEED